MSQRKQCHSYSKSVSNMSPGVSVSEGATQNAHKWALSQTSCVHCAFDFRLMFDHSMFRNLSPWSKNFSATYLAYAIWCGMVTRNSADGLQAVSLWGGMLPFISQDPLGELLSPLYFNAAFSISWVVICGATYIFFSVPRASFSSHTPYHHTIVIALD